MAQSRSIPLQRQIHASEDQNLHLSDVMKKNSEKRITLCRHLSPNRDYFQRQTIRSDF